MNTANEYLAQFLGGGSTAFSPTIIVASMGLALLLALLCAVVYQFTFRGFTYSRTFIHSMVLGSIVTCMLIMAVGSNLARGLGRVEERATRELARFLLREFNHGRRRERSGESRGKDHHCQFHHMSFLAMGVL